MKNSQKNLKHLQNTYENESARFRSLLHKGDKAPDVEKAYHNMQTAERNMRGGLVDLEKKLKTRGDIAQKESNRNLGITSAIGIPGLTALSYQYSKAKDQN